MRSSTSTLAGDHAPATAVVLSHPERLWPIGTKWTFHIRTLESPEAPRVRRIYVKVEAAQPPPLAVPACQSISCSIPVIKTRRLDYIDKIHARRVRAACVEKGRAATRALPRKPMHGACVTTVTTDLHPAICPKPPPTPTPTPPPPTSTSTPPPPPPPRRRCRRRRRLHKRPAPAAPGRAALGRSHSCARVLVCTTLHLNRRPSSCASLLSRRTAKFHNLQR